MSTIPTTNATGGFASHFASPERETITRVAAYQHPAAQSSAAPVFLGLMGYFAAVAAGVAVLGVAAALMH